MKDILNSETKPYMAGTFIPPRAERGARRFKGKIFNPGERILKHALADVKKMKFPARFDEPGRLALLSADPTMSRLRIMHAGGNADSPAELKREQLTTDLEHLINELGFLSARAGEVYLNIQASKAEGEPLSVAWYHPLSWWRALRDRY